MGADIKSLRTRIKSVSSTMQLTKAMELVASSKLRRAIKAMENARDYADGIGKMVDALLSCSGIEKSPYLQKNENGVTKIIVIAGDRGMAGGYNANIFRAIREYPDAEIIPIGRRATERYEKDFVSSEYYSTAEAYELAKKLCDEYLEGGLTRVGILGTKYINAMTQEPELTWILPLERKGEKKSGAVFLFEPDEETVLSQAIPEYVAGMIMAAIKESFASEVYSRRNAMETAGKNAKEMIDTLQLQYNRARQGAITQEITEIVAGAGE